MEFYPPSLLSLSSQSIPSSLPLAAGGFSKKKKGKNAAGEENAAAVGLIPVLFLDSFLPIPQTRLGLRQCWIDLVIMLYPDHILTLSVTFSEISFNSNYREI